MAKKIQITLEFEVQDDDYETDYKVAVETNDCDFIYNMLVDTDIEEYMDVVKVTVV